MKPELLAPAGGPEQLEYALRFGADAIYMAGSSFGMRSRACNFDDDALRAAIAYTHEHESKAYITCNVMMHEDDMVALPAFLEMVDDAGADALIIGDLGAFSMAKKRAPHVALHVSTQASVSNAEAAKIWHSLGAKRIVCAREMSLDQIAELRAGTPDDLELECFVHGSMCMAYSGRCLISDFTTGRSAQSGNCTQPCRWSYALEEEKRPGEYFGIEQDGYGSYLLNAQDLNMLAHLRELEEAGIDSIKIEGRNKKGFYVACVVNAYRQVLDGADPAELAAELECVSHRPYSTGFFFGPAHQAAQSDSRSQSCELAATVLGCEQEADGRFTSLVRCRNAFAVGDDLEVLTPNRPIAKLEIEVLEYHSVDGEPEDEPLPVKRANRTMELYRIAASTPLREGDIIRRRLP